MRNRDHDPSQVQADPVNPTLGQTEDLLHLRKTRVFFTHPHPNSPLPIVRNCLRSVCRPLIVNTSQVALKTN